MALLQTINLAVVRSGAPSLYLPDIRVEANRKILLLGPSGSGKTTLLSVMAGLLPPTAGQVLLEGNDLYAMGRAERDRRRARTMGFIFQTLHLLPSLTLRQNIALAAQMAGVAMDEMRIDALLSSLGLSDKAHRKPDALSQGEQQRAAIARAVLLRPKIIMADEPTSALDDANAEKVMQLLEQQARNTGAALLIATHDYRIIPHFPSVIRLDQIQGAAA